MEPGPDGWSSEVNNPEGLEGEEESAYLPRAGTALLSFPVRKRFTVGDIKRGQKGTVAPRVPGTCPEGAQNNTAELKAGPLHLPGQDPECCWSCWDAQRQDPRETWHIHSQRAHVSFWSRHTTSHHLGGFLSGSGPCLSKRAPTTWQGFLP